MVFLIIAFRNIIGFEGTSTDIEVRRERKLSFDENRQKKIGNFKKKAINASTIIRRSFSKKRRKSESQLVAVPIEDVRDYEEEQAVESFRQTLVSENLLPSQQDDYHMILRWLSSFNQLTH